MIKFKLPGINLKKQEPNKKCYHICADCKYNVKDFLGFEKSCLKNMRYNGETITKCNVFKRA